MAESAIEGLMQTAMGNIKNMVDVNTIVGEPMTASDGTIIIPVSKLSFGVAAGGSEFAKKETPANPMFGGGAGGGAKVEPVAFLVVGNGNVRLIPVGSSNTAVEKIIDLVPEMTDKLGNTVSSLFKKHKKDKE